MRVGWGFDAHRFGGDPPLLIGGVTVSTDRGLIGTSDGDVALHAAVVAGAVAVELAQFFQRIGTRVHRVRLQRSP